MNNTVLYVGVTRDLKRRIFEHKNKFVDGFTKRYNIRKLVYFETTNDVYSAITREKQMKKLSRLNKQKLIEKNNPNWQDLYNFVL